LREALENLAEVVLWPVYRIRAHGPGVGKVPLRGPLLVVCNHASYMDPIWLGKVVPRRLTPMMTSVHFDRPGIHFLVRHVANVIRVAASTFRGEAPELGEAVQRLRAGECVVIFPEGRMRRNDETLLWPFGQGVWHILRQAPDTPVVTVWIEGSWGSFFSYRNGPPGKNKRLDGWRRIDIAPSEPAPVPPEALADHRATRQYLQDAVLACRKHLGLKTA